MKRRLHPGLRRAYTCSPAIPFHNRLFHQVLQGVQKPRPATTS